MIARFLHPWHTRRDARWRRAAFVFAFSLGLPALSAAQSPAASYAERPAIAAPPVDSAGIALVLPLASEAFGQAAEAVRAGFLAAADATGTRPLVIGHGDGEVLVAFARARGAGARVIVGPLVRDDLRSVAGAALDPVPTIALNQLDEGARLPENMFTLTLTIDSDGRQLARRARDAGAMSVAVIINDSPLQLRFASAFNAEWILAGGGPPVMFRFDQTPEVLALLRRELAKTPFDAAVLAVDGSEAALAKSYVKSIPTFTSSLVNERQPRQALRDLDDVVFVDIPWLVDPDASDFAGLTRREFPNKALDRLYALGIDAFRAAMAFSRGPPARFDMDGATGRLSLDASRQFAREGRLMRFREGEIVSAGIR